MTIGIERLKTDREYWDECGAPEDATAAIINGWVKYGRAGPVESWFWWPFDRSMEQRWQQTSTDCEAYHVPFIPRPPKKAQEWSGDGLPPVGCECEVYYKGHETESSWQKCKILSHTTMYHTRNGEVIVFQVGDIIDWYVNPDAFRPMRTKEQRARDEVLSMLDEAVKDINVSIDCSAAIAATADAILSRYNLEPKK